MTKKGTIKQTQVPELKLQDTLRLSATGLGKVLGDLEVRVLRAVWKLRRPASARKVHVRVAATHDVQLLTVITVLNKLVDKGLLARAKQDDVFHYEALWSEAEFTAHASRRVVEGVLSLGPTMVAASLVDVLAERSPDQLANLARLVRERMKEDARGGNPAPAKASTRPSRKPSSSRRSR